MNEWNGWWCGRKERVNGKGNNLKIFIGHQTVGVILGLFILFLFSLDGRAKKGRAGLLSPREAGGPNIPSLGARRATSDTYVNKDTPGRY
jgi:hypothetical protein